MTPKASGVFAADPAVVRMTAQRVAMIEDAARAAGVPLDLALGVVYVESRFQPNATSKVGARGLMQIMPATWAELAKRLDLDASQPYDEAANVRAGTALLAALAKRFSDVARPWCWAIPSYYAGAGNVAKYGASHFDRYTRAVAWQWHRFATARATAIPIAPIDASPPSSWRDAICFTTGRESSGGGTPRPKPHPSPSPRPSPRPNTNGGGMMFVIFALALVGAVAWR